MKTNGFKYYEIVLYYINNIISISADSINMIKNVKTVFKLKRDKTEISDIYLGGSIAKTKTGTGTDY